MSSSLIPATSVCLQRRGLLEVFADVPDPRKRRGIRHRLGVILTLAQLAVLAGATTLLAISEWVVDADRDALQQAGIDPGVGLPSESAIRRTLASVDAAGLDVRLAAWMALRVGMIGGRRVIAVDGKTMRGAGGTHTSPPHLVAAFDHTTGTVLGQLAAAHKSNEIPALRDLLDTMDITGAVVTADAMHCQRDTAQHIRNAAGHYVLTVKGNQPLLRNRLKNLPWKQIRETTSVDPSHGRRVRRTVKTIEAPTLAGFPGAVQVLQIRRTRTIKGRKTVEVAYAICSLDMIDAQPHQIAAWLQGHWNIENQLHWVRDVTFNEDKHQLRTAHGPQVMATLRNTAISILRLTGNTRIATALRHNARHTHRPIHLLLTT